MKVRNRLQELFQGDLSQLLIKDQVLVLCTGSEPGLTVGVIGYEFLELMSFGSLLFHCQHWTLSHSLVEQENVHGEPRTLAIGLS